MPTHYRNGISNTAPGDALYEMGQLDPTAWITFFEDFTSNNSFPLATSGLAAASNGTWTITVTEAGVGNASSAVSDGNGGLLLITNDANDDDAVFAQHKFEAYLLSASKKAFFKMRFKVSDATQSDFVMGLQIRDTTPLDATDGIYFQKDDGDAQLDFYVRKDATTGSNSTTNIATIANDTFITVAWYFDGSRAHYFIDNVLKGSLAASSTYLPDTEIAVSFGFQNGSAGAKSMTVDYIFAAVER